MNISFVPVLRKLEKRKSHRQIYLMNEFLTKIYGSYECDVDFKHACVWVGDVGELVSRSLDDESFIWNDDVIAQAGIVVDKVRRRVIQPNSARLEQVRT